MTPLQIELVRITWRRVRLSRAATVAGVCAALRDRAPEVHAWCSSDLQARGALLMCAVDALVDGLGRPGDMEAAVRPIAHWCGMAGLQPRQARAIGAALLAVIERRLGGDFTVDARQAWRRAFAMLAAASARGMPLKNSEDGLKVRPRVPHEH